MKDNLLFVPLLLIYSMILLVLNSDNLSGDEGRYIMYATNLLNGYFSPRDHIELWNGPGYPIILMPFIKFNLPFMTAKLLNPAFLFMAVLYFYHLVCLYIKKRPAIFFSYILGMYPPFSRFNHLLLTEALSIYLVCGFLFHYCKLYQEKKSSIPHLLIAGFYLGYLALTKIFYGYVILIGLLISLCLCICKKNLFKKTFLVYLLALLFCVPYLAYTYSLTGKVFYWGNRAGHSLYLMSSPYPGEFGDWFEKDSKNHNEMYGKLTGLSAVEIDNEFKKQAIRNIANHPVKYVLNLTANVGRLFFNYPFSYDYQKPATYFYMIPNMFLFVISTLSLYPAYLRRRMIPFEIYGVVSFALISLGGLTIVQSENRSLWPLLPVFILWISFTLTRILKINYQN